MATLFIAIASGVAFIVAYHTYGRWLGSKIFNLAADVVCPSQRLRDDKDYIPTPKAVVWGHHFTSIAGTGPIVGPAIAVMWGWLPALLWVVLGSIFIGAVHDFGALVVSLRNNGQTVGDIAGRVLNKRVRLLFLFILFMALTIVLAIFGLVIAVVFRQYPAAIFPCIVQIPIAVAIGLYLHRRGVSLLIPSVVALAIMYATVISGNVGWLGAFNAELASWPVIVWVVVLLVYSYVASVLPVWVLLQPRDYINSLQLLTALALVLVGLGVAALVKSAPPVEGAVAGSLKIVAPIWNFQPSEAPVIFPFLFITIACGAISGFHCLVSSGTSSKQLQNEPDAKFVGYGGMVTEGFLATLVILACVAGLGLGAPLSFEKFSVGEAGEVDQQQAAAVFYTPQDEGRTLIVSSDGYRILNAAAERDSKNQLMLTANDLAAPMTAWDPNRPIIDNENRLMIAAARAPAVHAAGQGITAMVTEQSAWNTRYHSWKDAKGLGPKVAAFVDGSANFLRSIGIPLPVALALMGVLVASFAGTTLDTACRLQRYVIQELATTVLRRTDSDDDNESEGGLFSVQQAGVTGNPLTWFRNKHGATLLAIVLAAGMAALPSHGKAWTMQTAGSGGLILWPMFGATNQLLGGLAFLVITFYLWRRNKPIFFIILPLLFMLVMPAWAMLMLLPRWIHPPDGNPNWSLIVIAFVTLALEIWMILEALLLMPKVKGVLERDLVEPITASSGV